MIIYFESFVIFSIGIFGALARIFFFITQSNALEILPAAENSCRDLYSIHFIFAKIQ
jgi:hypothetical protein